MGIRTVLGVKEEEHKLLPQKPPLGILKNMMNCGMVSVVPCYMLDFLSVPQNFPNVYCHYSVSFKAGIV